MHNAYTGQDITTLLMPVHTNSDEEQACKATVNRPITPAMVQASPDMLDALKTAREVLVNALRYLIDDEETEALDADAIIEAAIAKAEGSAS